RYSVHRSAHSCPTRRSSDLEVLVSMENGEIAVEPRDQSRTARSKWGMSRTQIANILTGVKEGFEKKLEISGVGYRAAMQGKDLQLALGFSHDVIYKAPEGITISRSEEHTSELQSREHL